MLRDWSDRVRPRPRRRRLFGQEAVIGALIAMAIVATLISGFSRYLA